MVNIPADVLAAFKAAQADVFQDQDIDYYAETEVTDANGWRTQGPAATKTGTISDCNISEDIEEIEAAKYGLTSGKSIRIVKSSIMALSIGAYVKYGTRYFKIKAERKSDFSHTVYGELWK